MTPELDAVTACWLQLTGRFRAAEYAERYPDVAVGTLDAWAHFRLYGWWLGRCPAYGQSPIIATPVDPPDVPALAQAILDDPDWQICRAFMETPLMDPAWYRARYPDVAAAGVDPHAHYSLQGGGEGREPGPWFDSAHYLAQCDALPTEAPLLHYLRVGQHQGLTPYPMAATLPDWYTRAVGHAQPDPVTLLTQLPIRPDRQSRSRRRVLFILPLDSGGTPQANQDLMAALTADWGVECLLLRCREAVMQLLVLSDGVLMPLAEHCLSTPAEPFPHEINEYDEMLSDWIRAYGVALVHVRHLAWNSLGLYRAARAQRVPVVTSLHDFYPVCPSVKLLDENNQYCAGACTASAGECAVELWSADAFPPLKHASIHRWQAQFAEALAQSAALVTTTETTRETFVERMPGLGRKRWRIIPHGRDLALQDCAHAPEPGQPLRVALLGHLTVAKGGGLVQALAARHDNREVEFHVFGRLGEGIDLPAHVRTHGPYNPGEQADVLAAIKPHVGAVLSIWPETWCHTLTELWAAGLPVIGVELGAVGQRLRASGAGWLVPTPTLEGVEAALAQAREPTAWAERQAAVLRWQETEGMAQNTAAMASGYVDLYRSLGVRMGDRRPSLLSRLANLIKR